MAVRLGEPVEKSFTDDNNSFDINGRYERVK